jgi:hypothetical protein
MASAVVPGSTCGAAAVSVYEHTDTALGRERGCAASDSMHCHFSLSLSLSLTLYAQYATPAGQAMHTTKYVAFPTARMVL